METAERRRALARTVGAIIRTEPIIERLAQAGIFVALDGGELKAFGPNGALERHADLIRANKTALTHRFRARLFLDRDGERQALETFCRADCPDLRTYTLMSDNGPAWRCLHEGGDRLHGMTTCPMRGATANGG